MGRWSKPDLPPLPRPATEQMRELYSGYQGYLATMSPSDLAAEVSRLGALIEQDQRAQMQSQLSRATSSTNLDQPVIRSDPMGTPFPSPSQSSERPVDRGAAASAPRPPGRTPSPMELLLGTSRMGPRLAAKLVLADRKRYMANE